VDVNGGVIMRGHYLCVISESKSSHKSFLITDDCGVLNIVPVLIYRGGGLGGRLSCKCVAMSPNTDFVTPGTTGAPTKMSESSLLRDCMKNKTIDVVEGIFLNQAEKDKVGRCGSSKLITSGAKDSRLPWSDEIVAALSGIVTVVFPVVFMLSQGHW
jgi:hypothetical protein